MAQHRDDNWFRHALEHPPWRSQQRASLVLAVVVIVAVIGALYLAQASRTAGAGRRLQTLEAQRQALEQQNAQLRAEIAALRSVPRLIDEAERMGFRQAGVDEVEYMYLEDVPPPAEPVEAAMPPPPEEEVVPAYEETLESWLSAQLATFREQTQLFVENTFGGEREETR
jgi:cell division protein FtsB